MTKPKKEISSFLLLKMEIGERIIDEYGKIETIYGIKEEVIGKYISTIATDDERFQILKTYFVKKNKKENRIKEISGQKRNLLKNLEKATLDYIESDIKTNKLTS